MQFTVDLQPEEYRRAMLWQQFASTMGKRVNDWAAWAILVLVPLTLLLLVIFAPDALSFWFWPVALLAFVYSLYSTLLIRYQIGRQAASLWQTNPALAHSHYHIHQKGIRVTATGDGPDGEGLFLPWKEIKRVAESSESFLVFVTDEQILILPKRCVGDWERLRRLMNKGMETALEKRN
ncbi:MAG: YcxB family protein [Caldilineaceae bacterium]|nr:YcxB family protein [Caldilineaceae bacterium]